MKVLFVSSEVEPFAKTGGLGDVAGALPRYLIKQDCDVRVIMPYYKTIRAKYENQTTFLGWHMIQMGWRNVYCGILEIKENNVTYYFVDNEYYFNHDALYIDYSFDIERFSFFQRAVLESLEHPIGFIPDILHLHDWQTGMIPCLLEAHYRPYQKFKKTRTLFTIHNLKYQGIHGRERIADFMDLPESFITEESILHDGVANFMKTGIVYADHVTTVSPTYAEEIKHEFYGEGLHTLLNQQAHKLTGVLNGIDDEHYNPGTDPELEQNFTSRSWKKGKASCKAALQAELGLKISASLPLVAMVTRLVEQKGLDLLLHVLDELMDQSLQLAILGTGEKSYEQALEETAGKNPDYMTACIRFDDALARRMYAGADLFLMPSLFEPCGLSQMIAMRYGTLPVVRETGGLKDTVQPFNQYTGVGNGFSFTNINAHEMLFTTRYACDVYRHMPEAWSNLVKEAMNSDFSWNRSAAKYLELYRMLLESK